MSDDEYRNGFGEGDIPAAAPTEAPAEEPVKTEEEIAAETAKAEEDFISTPEDTVENPLVPEEKTDDEDEDRLKGAIGSGNLAVDYPEEAAPAEEPAVEETPAEAPVEEAPVAEAPAEEAAPATETPVEEAPAAAPVAEATATVADYDAPKKKSKAGLIITLVVIFLLLIGGGVGFFIWMMSNESPENLLKDSLAKLWTSENIQMAGTLSNESKKKDDGASSFEITFDGAKSGGNITGSGKIKGKASGADINIDFSASYIKGGEAYFKLEGLKKLVKSLGLEDGDDESGISSLMGDYSALLSSLLGAIVKKVDGQWYKITASEAKENSVTKSAGCMLENIDGALDPETMKKVADIYKEHPFIAADKDSEVKEENGVKFIVAKINKDESKKFAEEVKKIDSMKKIAACSDEKEEEEEDEKNAKDTKVTLGIKPWSHELVSAVISSEGEEGTSKLDVKMTYDKKDISAPSDAKAFDKLGSEIEEAVKDAMSDYIDEMCKKTYGSYGQSLVDYCKQAAQQQMGNFDPSQLLGGFMGSNSSTEL